MVDTAASVLAPAVQDLARWVGASIKRQFNYLCCFTTNIATLEKEAKNLQDTAADLQRKVDSAKDDLQIISDEVKTWLQDSKDIGDEINGILRQVPNLGTGCLKLRARFSLSKKAKKKIYFLKEHQDKCNKFTDDTVAQPPPPPAQGAIPLESTYEFESRKQIEQDIMETLRGGHVMMMGICGMGGLGKTTIAKRVANKALEEHAFEEIVFVVVSQPLDKSRVQLEIGKSLGLTLEGESWQGRVQKLHARLSGTKRILLVLDDVWERLVLEDLGIPCNHKGCTILLTSRNRDALSDIDDKNIFGMQLLSDKDAWLLFSERVGTCVNNRDLKSIAKEVVNECKGLPIALTTVGAALRDEMNVGIWKDALQQFRKCDPDIPELIANVYTPLKLSYDVLGPKQKSIFLLCCLYREDADIPLDDLTYFCMGLGIFEGSIEEASNKMLSLANMLKRRSLLLDGGYKYVRMHDVVRDVCIFIAKQEGRIGGNSCSWISLTPSFQLTEDLGNPKLRLLSWTGELANEEFKSRFLEGVRDLRVLSIAQDYLLTSLPLTTQSLKNLKTLVLKSCAKLEALSGGVGELVNLEILNCDGCNLIKELPLEMKGLNRLKLLNLSYCYSLERIGKGIISSLVGLEELKMLESFKKWEAEDREERGNAALRELEALTNLRCLEIDIEDHTLAAENMCLSSKLERYKVRFIQSMGLSYLLKKSIFLSLEEESKVGDWIEMKLLRDAESLLLSGNGASKVDFTELENIKGLHLRNCENTKKIVTSSMDDCGGATLLSAIEFLYLEELPKLEEIWDGQISSNFFQNLNFLQLHNLPALKQVWKGNSQGIDYLPRLTDLSIWNCPMMERVFFWEGEEENKESSTQLPNSHHITTKILPKVMKLELADLPNLTSFYQGIQRIEFPQLMELTILKCSQMKMTVSKGKESSENNSGGRSSKAQIQDLDWHPQEMSFGCPDQITTDWSSFSGCKIDVSLFNGLEDLTIDCYEGSVGFITPSIAKNLVNLKQLYFFSCYEMVHVIEDDEEKLVSDGGKTLLFPELVLLRLVNLSKLVSFCEWKYDVELPSLRDLEIKSCHNMEYFTLGRLDTPNLERVRIDGVVLGVEKDLNVTVRQCHLTLAKETSEATIKKEAETAGVKWFDMAKCYTYYPYLFAFFFSSLFVWMLCFLFNVY